MSERNGLSPEQWTELYERAECKQLVLSTLHEIACCVHAHPRVREESLAIWGLLLAEGRVAAAPVDGDFRPFPVLVRDTHCSIVRGRKDKVGTPIVLDKDLREQMAERLEGVKQMVFAITQFKKVREMDDEISSLIPPIDVASAN